jgi:antitoxin component YwqK of YwqJK toxin-antitoxin module
MSDVGRIREFSWHGNGRLMCAEYKNKNNKLEGERRVWYTTGQLRMREFYLDDKLEGKSEYWHENGQLESQDFFQNRKPEGISKWWYNNGQIRGVEFRKNGQINGICRGWDMNGNLIYYTLYEDGDCEDGDFSMKKKMNIVHVKRRLLSRVFDSHNSLSDFLIKDLISVIN